MKDRTLLRTGIAATVIAAMCCVTAILVVLLGVLGLSAAIGYLDFVLFPALAFFWAWRSMPFGASSAVINKPANQE